MGSRLLQLLLLSLAPAFSGATTTITAVAEFEAVTHNGVAGTITFSRRGEGATSITISMPALARCPCDWHVHVGSTTNGTSCDDTGGHFNPYGVDAYAHADNCTGSLPTYPETTAGACEVGDLGAKFGNLAATSSESVYSDVFLPLSGDESIVGGSVVIHEVRGVAWHRLPWRGAARQCGMMV